MHLSLYLQAQERCCSALLIPFLAPAYFSLLIVRAGPKHDTVTHFSLGLHNACSSTCRQSLAVTCREGTRQHMKSQEGACGINS